VKGQTTGEWKGRDRDARERERKEEGEEGEGGEGRKVRTPPSVNSCLRPCAILPIFANG